MKPGIRILVELESGERREMEWAGGGSLTQPLFDFEPGRRDTAFAVDIGTATVVVLLVDLVSGEVLSRAGGFNEQIRFGDTVVTRIESGRKAETLAAMQRAVVAETIQPLLLRACERAQRDVRRIVGGAVAGNTTMLHLLVREGPTPLGIAPFTPRFISRRRVSVGDLGLHVFGVGAALSLQLLPGVREEQIRVVGNTSLAGALLALVDRTTLDEMENLREQVQVIELNLADGFEDRYIGHLLLP